jgi:ribose 5-phosphate isomerase B
MKIYLGADHRGFELKEKLKSFLRDLGFDYQDLGASIYNKEDDYPDFAKLVGEKVVADLGSRGILICGSGIGIAIAANKIKGVRAGTALKSEQAAADDTRIMINDE